VYELMLIVVTIYICAAIIVFSFTQSCIKSDSVVLLASVHMGAPLF